MLSPSHPPLMILKELSCVSFLHTVLISNQFQTFQTSLSPPGGLLSVLLRFSAFPRLFLSSLSSSAILPSFFVLLLATVSQSSCFWCPQEPVLVRGFGSAPRSTPHLALRHADARCCLPAACTTLQNLYQLVKPFEFCIERILL